MIWLDEGHCPAEQCLEYCVERLNTKRGILVLGVVIVVGKSPARNEVGTSQCLMSPGFPERMAAGKKDRFIAQADTLVVFVV